MLMVHLSRKGELCMREEVRWERMFPDELDAAFERRPLAWLTYGLCEPHGPHNALGLDALKAHSLACAAARKHGGIVAPAEYWHIHEIGRFAASTCLKKLGEKNRTWLTAVPPWIFFRNVLFHIRAADAHGFHAAMIITGHGGCHTKDLKTLLEFWQPHFAMRLLGLMDHDVLGDGKGDHAGRIETSQLWALEPDCVDFSRLPKEWAPYPDNYATGLDAGEADRRQGEQMIAEQVERLGQKARELLDAYRVPAEGRRPCSFADMDRLWEKTMREVFPKLEIMVQQVEGWPPPPASSRWMLNWKIVPPVN
jgi:creatinine amidohydrolase